MSIENIKDYFTGACVGFAIGIVTEMLIGRPRVDNGKVFQREQGKPAVMRLYKVGPDRILVENPERKGEYIPMDRYLSKIQDKAERKIEEAQIEKAVKWYEE